MLYNPYLSAKYNAHINVEICVSVKACKYIFKYIYKNNDRASLRIVRQNDSKTSEIAMNSMNKI